MTSTAALYGRPAPDETDATTGLATDDAILILGAGSHAVSTIAKALADAGMTARLATPAMVETGVRSGDIAVVVMSGAALRCLAFDPFVAALADQPPGLEAMIIAVDTDGDDLAQRVARLDAATTLVPIEPPIAATMAIHVVRAALRARRRHRDCNAEADRGAAAAFATRRLAETFDARVAQRAPQTATTQETWAFASDRLCEIDERNRAVVELSDLILFTTDADGTVTKVDDRLFAVTGYPRDRLMSIGSDKPGVHPDDRERIRALQIASRDTGTPVDHVHRILVADGSYRWWHLRARPVFNAEGHILRWNGILADIHDRKVAEEQLRESELRHRASIALSHLITFTLNADGQLDDIDDRICELTGISMPDLLANAPDGICHPDDLPLLVRLRDEALETRSYDQTVRIRHAAGDYKWWRLRAAPRLAADGATIGWFGTMEDVNLLVIARERLRASEEIHRFSVELSDQVVWSAYADGTLASIGDALFERLGIARDVWMAMSRAERVHPDDFERVVAINIDTVKNNTAADYRFRMRCGDGSYRWWRSRYAPLLDVDGCVIRWHGMLEDVDALARAEEELRESEERYRFAIQMSNLVTYTATADGRIDAMDDITAAATGFSIEEILSKGSDFTWHPDHLAAVKAARVEALVTGQYDQTHLMDNRDGTYRWWRSRAAAYRDGTGKIVRWHGTLENVDELKRAEERLRESEDRHRFCIGLSKLVTYTATTDAIIESIDATITTATGIDSAEIIGTPPTSFCHPDDVDGLVEALLSARQFNLFDHTYRIRDANGSYRWWRSRSQPRRDEAGNIARWYGTMEDIDDLHSAEERLRESENRHRFCIGLSKLITYTTTPTGTVESIDVGIFAATGVRACDIVGGTPLRGCHPDDRAGLKAAYAITAVTGAFDHCYRLLSADGNYRWYRSRSQPHRDESGNIVRWYGTLEDIDDLHSAQERLRESEDRHRFCIGLSKLITYTATPTATIESIDEGIFAALGIRASDLVGGKPLPGCHPDDYAGLKAAYWNAGTTGAFDHCYRLVSADGSYRWYRSRSQPRRDESGNIVRWYGTLEDIDDLRRAEERLRDSEELHRHAVELSNLIVWTTDPKGRMLSVSPRIFKILGLTREMAASLRPLSLVHPDDLPAAAAALQAGLGDGVPADFRLRLRIADGSYRWWRLRSSPLRADDGAIVRWYGTLDDVDELTRSEERLRDSEELHRFSVELSNQVVWTGTPEGRLLSVGPNLLQKLGLKSDDLLRVQPEQRVHPDDLEAANMARRHSINAGVPADFQCRLQHNDGCYHWWRIRAAPHCDADGATIRWYGTLEDVDELKRAGERLRETEELYRYTVELSEQIVFTASAVGKITSVGARWTQVSGLPADAVLGDGIFAFVHPDDRAHAADGWALRIADGIGADLCCRIADASGEYRWWRIRAAQRRGAAGDVIGWYGTVEDIDAATRAEQKLKQVQAEMVHMSRLNAMGAMASTLAHELNQPLAAVINYISGSRRLLDDTSGPTIQRVGDAMHKAQDCAFRASEIIRRVRMQVSRGDGHQSVVTAGSLVQDACNIALINARELGINLVIDLDPAATSVYGDNIQFQQILINLLRNAVDAVSGQAERRIVVSTRLEGSHLAFTVDDSGPGVDETMEARLFEPFESSKPNGMGIGLSISRTIAESHGGKLEYEPSALGGARFTMLLPRSTEPEHRA